MFTRDQYELLDFGDGRKLERLGPFVLNRPCPAADGQPRPQAERWSAADARFEAAASAEGRGRWKWKTSRDDPTVWQIAHGPLQFELRPTPFGHLGVFPEQAANWDWIGARIRRAKGPLRVLNLFAYTGGSTLAAAAAGAEVVHVDAAKNVVAWARRNAELSNLADAPIRWITEDARKFVRREINRGERYDAVILDPPSYGHGPGGEVWKIERHLPELLADCGKLTEGRREFLLLTCHSPSFGLAEAQACFADSIFGHCQNSGRAEPLFLSTADGRRLPSGIAVRWPG